MPSEADAAMQAVNAALDGTADPSTFLTAESAKAKQQAEALAIVTRHVAGETIKKDEVIEALDTLAWPLGQMLSDDDEGFWGETDPAATCDMGQLAEALARARCGQIDDALHHLDRALPAGFGCIAERIAREFDALRRSAS